MSYPYSVLRTPYPVPRTPYPEPGEIRVTIEQSRVTIHMVASLDGFIARRDGRVDWLETTDTFPDGATLTQEEVEAFLATVDCYVMGSHTYETALRFDAAGAGWAYGDVPTFVLTTRELPRPRASVEFRSGDLAAVLGGELRARFRNIWVVGGSAVAGACLQQGLADEICYSMVPFVLGDGVPSFGNLDRDVALHLTKVTPYANGMIELRYEVRRASS